MFIDRYLKKRPGWAFAACSILLICIVFFATILSQPLLPAHADSPAPAWDGNFVSYQAGTLVTYDGKTYQCIQSHTSEPNWTPSDTAALWQLESQTFTSQPQQLAVVAPTLKTDQVGTQTQTGMVSVTATFYTDIGTMADGQQTHLGACAVYIPQFPLGTKISLYYSGDLSQPAYTCTAEDTGTHICWNDIDVALPGEVAEAIQLGDQQMLLQVTGFDSQIAQEAAANHYSSVGCELGVTH